MKISTIYPLFFSLLVILACQQPAPKQDETSASSEAETFDQAAEQAAIMAVIESETKCFFERDYDCWKQHWIHEDYACQAWNNADGTFDAAVGWEAINQQGKSYIEDVPEGEEATSPPVIKRDGLQCKFYSNSLAYLLWKQYGSTDGKSWTTSQEVRIMEKRDGAWKIVNVSAFWDNVNKIPADSLGV
ncbi:MAG: hypothetical protein R3B47_17535 [Bacteroidia bacterium]